MDWQAALIAWGPAIPMLFFFLRAHRDIVYKIVPRGLNLIKATMRETEERAENRHAATLESQKEIIDELKKLRRSWKKTSKVCEGCAAANASGRQGGARRKRLSKKRMGMIG